MPVNSSANLVRLRAGNCQWWVRPEFQGLLFGANGLRLEEWSRAGQAYEIKRGLHRIVYRVELPGLVFYLKHNLLPDFRSWLRQFVRPNKARLEFTRALDVSSRGLATVVPLAVGEPASILGGESFLITRSLEDTKPLKIFLADAAHQLPFEQQSRFRQNLARELGLFMGRIHQAGILHRDLHTENILIRVEADLNVKLFLIDLDGVEMGSPLSWSDSLQNLVVLNRWFIFRTHRTDRLRFWRTYYKARQEAGWGGVAAGADDELILARFVEEGTYRIMQQFCSPVDRRCIKNNRSCRRIQGDGVHGFATAQLAREDWTRLLVDPDEPFRRPDAKLLKDSPTSTVVEISANINGRSCRVIYKRFAARENVRCLASLFRPSPALRSWIYGHGFINRSLPTPRPFLLLERGRWGLAGEGYLMTEKIDAAQDLNSFLKSLQGLPARRRLRCLRHRITQIGRLMKEMHHCGYANRDTKASNWLVVPSESTPSLERSFGGLWIIDLVGIAQPGRLTNQRRWKNIARLNASFFQNPYLTRADRLRFLRSYLQWNLLGRNNWKRWWRSIESYTERKVALNQSRGRIVD